MPFQELSRRKRKDVKVEDIQVRVCLFAFDLLYLNGEVSSMLHVTHRLILSVIITPSTES
jgi:ATP-dependent DNA ligase